MTTHPPGSVVHVGVTGTRSGMTPEQKQDFTDFLYEVVDESVGSEIIFHHGDCVGADEQAAKIAEKLGFLIVAHPPIKEENRAHYNSDVIVEPKDYLARNRDIVDVCTEVFACPKSLTDHKGGTWYTIRYAQEHGVKVTIVEP